MIPQTADGTANRTDRLKSMAERYQGLMGQDSFREFYYLIYWELCLLINVVCLKLFVLIFHDPDGPSISARLVSVLVKITRGGFDML